MKKFDIRVFEETPALYWTCKSERASEAPRKKSVKRGGDVSARLYRYLRQLDR